MLCHAMPPAITHIIDQVHLYSSLIRTLSLMAALKIATVGGIKDIARGSIKVWRSSVLSSILASRLKSIYKERTLIEIDLRFAIPRFDILTFYS
ncbi:unnamed protein product [Camellia sinensis]